MVKLFDHPAVKMPLEMIPHAIKVLLVTRKQVTSSRTNEISARAFANPDTVINYLTKKFESEGHKYQLVVADFADMPFDYQVSS